MLSKLWSTNIRSPYSPDTPWHAFDFAFHALEIEADVLIVCMSWLTRKEPRDFSRTLGEPDMETLTYWVQRLEPLVRAELEREVIVVFCNRSGQEEEALYAGTCAVIGIKEGEVSVYGLAGRGTKEFLFVDTSLPPFAKLVQNEDDNYESKQVGDILQVSEVPRPGSVDPSKWNVDMTKWPTPPSSKTAPSNAAGAPTGSFGVTSMPSRHSQPAAGEALPAKKEKPSPKLQIPEQATFSNSVRPTPTEKDSPSTIPTPTAPSPTPMAIRPKLIIPEQNVINAGFSRKPSPFPHDKYFLEQHRFFGSRVQAQVFTPITPLEEVPQASTQASKQASTQGSARFYWKPSDTLLKTPANMNFSFADTPTPDSPIASKGMALGALTPFPGEEVPPLTARPGKQGSLSNIQTHTRRTSTSLRQSETLSPYDAALSPQMEATGAPGSGARPDTKHAQREGPPPRPPNPVSRNNNNNNNHNRGKEEARSAATSSRQEPATKQSQRPSPPRRTASAADNRAQWPEKAKEVFHPVRTDSPKSRHASRSQSIRADSMSEQRFENVPRPTHSHTASTPVTNSIPNGVRPPSRAGHGPQDELRRPQSRTTARPGGNPTARHARSRSAGAVPRDTTDVVKTETTRQRSSSRSPPGGKRPVSRGRQRFASGQSPPRGDSQQASVSLAQDTKDTILITRRVSVTRIHSSSRPSGVRKATPEDDIVAVEEYVDPECVQHFQRAPSASAPQGKIPSIADGRAILGAHCNLPPPPPVYHLEDDMEDDTQTHSPAVLGGRVKTTIITVPHGVSLDSIASPLPSANSVTSTMSQTSQASIAPSSSDRSDGTTPDKSRYPTQTPRPVVATYVLAEEKRADTPIPALCETCGSPRPGSHHSDEEGRRPKTNFW